MRSAKRRARWLVATCRNYDRAGRIKGGRKDGERWEQEIPPSLELGAHVERLDFVARKSPGGRKSEKAEG